MLQQFGDYENDINKITRTHTHTHTLLLTHTGTQENTNRADRKAADWSGGWDIGSGVWLIAIKLCINEVVKDHSGLTA